MRLDQETELGNGEAPLFFSPMQSSSEKNDMLERKQSYWFRTSFSSQNYVQQNDWRLYFNEARSNRVTKKITENQRPQINFREATFSTHSRLTIIYANTWRDFITLCSLRNVPISKQSNQALTLRLKGLTSYHRGSSFQNKKKILSDGLLSILPLEFHCYQLILLAPTSDRPDCGHSNIHSVTMARENADKKKQGPFGRRPGVLHCTNHCQVFLGKGRQLSEGI